MPEISVIIPVYNGEKTLKACLDSVFSQEYDDYEVIAVDDGSRDGSLKILQNYEKLKIISQQNAGVSIARNKGASVAKGKYIAFIDQDDSWLKTKLTKQISAITDNANVSYVFCDFKRYNIITDLEYPLSNTQLNNFIYKYPVVKLDENNHSRTFSRNVARDLLLKGYPIYPSTILIKAELLEQTGGWNRLFPRCQDLDLSLRCTKYTEVCYIDDVLTRIGRHESNVSSDFIDQLEEDILVLKYFMEYEVQTDRERLLVKKYLGERLCGLAWHHFNLGRRQVSRKRYKMALRFRNSFLRALMNLPFTYWPLNYIKKLRAEIIRDA